MFDPKYMERAMQLATMGLGYVSPNPLVGCVIVHDDLIIGEGYHHKYGGPHAEVHAIDNVVDKSLLGESILYVSLEPCSHFGKTPPCVELILKHRIPTVIISNLDPNPLVSGTGIQKLREAGVQVHVGVLEKEGQIVNRRFFTSMIHNRPYIILKWAESADGFIFHEKQNKISNSLSDMEVHKWRSEEDSILIGARTLQVDNPRLNVRHWPRGRNPLRLLLSKNKDLDFGSHFFDQSQSSLLFYDQESSQHCPVESFEIKNELLKMCQILHGRGVQSIIVEGGAATHRRFIEAKLYDEFRVIKSDIILGSGVPACPIPAGIPLQESFKFKNDSIALYNHLGF